MKNQVSAADTRGNLVPVTFGVPFPKGASSDRSSWLLSDGEGRRSKTQTRILDRWADGSTRWLLVDAVVAGPSHDGSDFVLEPGTFEANASDLSVTERDGEVSVDTGVARFAVDRTTFPLRSARVAGPEQEWAETLNSALSEFGVTDDAGNAASATLSSISVEEQGPVRAVVAVRGTVPLKQSKLAFEGKLHFFVGLTAVRIVITVRNPNSAVHPGGFWDLGDAGSMLFRGAALTVGLAGPCGQVTVSPEAGASSTDYQVPFTLYQDSSGGDQWRSANHINRWRRVPTAFQGYRIEAGAHQSSGLRATPALTAGRAAIVVPEFWQNFPQTLEASAQSITWQFWSKEAADLHEIQGGEQKTFECYLSFGTPPASNALEWLRAGLVPCVDPQWTLSSGAVPFLSTLDENHAALVDSAVEGPDRFELKREVIDEYGWRHFGEIYGDHESIRQKNPPIVSHYNNQYDPIAGFILQFLRTADPRWWQMADELARHVIDIDVYHTTQDKWAYNHGLFWHTYHYGDADTCTHRTYPSSAKGRIHGGGPSADHNYTTGLMLHYFLRGAAASRQTVIDLGQFVIDLDDGQKTPFRWLAGGPTGQATLSAGYYGPGRGPANSLNATIDAYRLSGDRRFLKKADEIIRRVVHPRDDISRHRLDDPEERWFYTMFLQSLGKFLQTKTEMGELDASYAYGRDSLLHYARWMATNEYPYLEKPEKLEFPTETWAAQDIRKSDVFFHAALHTTGSERASFEERGNFFHQYSVDTLRSMSTSRLARPVIILTTSGLLRSWYLQHPEASFPAPAVQPDYGQHVLFVPQRVRAERRAKWIAAVTVAAGLVLLVSFFL